MKVRKREIIFVLILTAALLADGCERAAACDISAPSLEKARCLMERRGDASRVTFCLGCGPKPRGAGFR